MTLEEAQQLGVKLNEINDKYWFENPIDRKSLKAEFSALWRNIVSNGFKVKIQKIYSEKRNCTIKQIVVTNNKHKDAIAIVDNRSANATRKGDCTTRCICFCTGRDYDDVQREQFQLATPCHSWKNIYTWKKLLLNHGYSEIDLPRKVSRATFIRLFKDAGIDEGIIATLSSSHIAAIDMAQKKILDTWDSSGGRIYKIFVPSNPDVWKRKINALLG